MLAGFGRRGLIARRRSDADGRERHLELTARGRAAFAPLDRQSNADVSGMLSAISEPDQRRLLAALHTVEELLAGDSASPAPGPAFTLRAHRAGDMGWITHRQAVLYHKEYGWNDEYEALIAGIMSQFILKFDPARERCWIAERNGEIAGSVFVVKKTAATAQPVVALRGTVRTGTRNRGAARGRYRVRFARKKNYRTMMLWTNSVLVSARRLYEAAGFRLVEEEKHRSFGKDLIGQNWELKL